MSLNKARESIAISADLRGDFNHNAAGPVPTPVGCDHGGKAVYRLTKEFELEEVFGFTPGASLQ